MCNLKCLHWLTPRRQAPTVGDGLLRPWQAEQSGRRVDCIPPVLRGRNIQTQRQQLLVMNCKKQRSFKTRMGIACVQLREWGPTQT